MPKNAHPPRGNASKKPATDKSNAEDDSFIVFTNKKDDSKKKSQGKPAEVKQDSKGAKGKAADKTGDESQDAPKRPDTRTLIGGASWTGKLPVNMLSEHCQKQKWERPDYTTRNAGKGFEAFVVLKSKNPKTREVAALPPFRVPIEHKELAVQPTALEARHFAATYTLFRVANMKNIHMMMPPTYKDLWKGAFQDIKKEEEANGRGWQFEADPFAATERREAEKAATEKRRVEAQKERERREKDLQPGIVLPGMSNGTSGVSGQGKVKGWTKAPKVDLGKRTRQEVEKLIRSGASWNAHGLVLDKAARTSVVKDVTAMGFRASHVEEAADICRDKEEVLEWLLIHVPEDDLPRWALPDNYTAGVSMASADLKREAVVKRLASAGYSIELCEEMLNAAKDREAVAAALLQARLLESAADSEPPSEDLSKLDIHGSDASTPEAWVDEATALEAIFAERFRSSTVGAFEIDVQVSKPALTLKVRFTPPPGSYPAVLPIISIQAPLPSYIRLAIAKRALLHASSDLLGDAMIFNIIDWLENNVESIVENPGPLRDVSAAATAIRDEPPSKRRSARHARSSRLNTAGLPKPGSQTSLRLARAHEDLTATAPYKSMLATRQNLPAWALQDDIVQSVVNNPVTIISGETGSGKSTQSVQFILDDLIGRQLGEAANIICTQPRRISAMGLAERVADERCGRMGDEVGYAIRGESKMKPGTTKITFVTTGVLLRRLQSSGGNQDDITNALADVSHVVVDEVHERSLDTDFLLILLRDILRQRRDLRVVLMSATLDAQGFEKYFSSVGKVGLIEISGRTHPVTDYYLDDIRHVLGLSVATNASIVPDSNAWDDEEPTSTQTNVSSRQTDRRKPKGKDWAIDYETIADTVEYIDTSLGPKEGGILIFLPGTAEIDRTIRVLQNHNGLHVLPLHASLLPADQRRVFPPSPRGKRKVVCATNVAETSITIPDIVAVIDTGRVKETAYDLVTSMVRLAETWASRAACKQRRGRAGRVQAGVCYKLYTEATEQNIMHERPEPEIRRVPLEQLVLNVKSMGIRDVSSFLAGALTPPEASSVEGAITLLRRIGALDRDELTALGRHLSSVPADLRCAKLMVYGIVFGCLEACLTIASILTAKSPFISPPNVRDESKAVRSRFGAGNGDLIADLRAYEQWQALRDKGALARDVRAWCADNYLSAQTLSDVSSNRAQYLSNLKETSFVPLSYRFSDPATQGSLNKHSSNDALLRALIAASFTPQIARIEFPDKKFAASVSGAVALDPEARTIKYFAETSGPTASGNAEHGSQRVFLHPSSTLFDAQGFPEGTAFLSYFTKMATSKVFIRDATPLNAFALLMFGGAIEVDAHGRGLLVDGWIRLRGWARIGVLVSRLRMMLDEELEKRWEKGGGGGEGAESDVVRVVRKLVELGGMDR